MDFPNIFYPRDKPGQCISYGLYNGAERLTSQYFDKEDLGDIKFIVGGKKIKANKRVLSYSPKYKAQFEGGFADSKLDSIEIEDVSAAAFEEYLQFFYFGKASLTHKNIKDVLTLARSSLVDAYFDACINFLEETLSVDNVCQTYELAMKYEKKDLIERCEHQINLYTDKIFSLKEFLDYTSIDLFNILRSDSFNCKEIVLFDACILWAKRRCIGRNLDPESMDDLRTILTDDSLPGTLLHQIRFGTMSIGEFMECYKNFKHLFTESEKEEVLFTIAKVNHAEHTVFNAEPRNSPYWKWNEENSLQCDRILEKGSALFNSVGRDITMFSCNRRLWLGGFDLRGLFERPALRIMNNREYAVPNPICAKPKSVAANISVVQNKKCPDLGVIILYNTTETITLTAQETFVKLCHPVLLQPNFVYEIKCNIYESIEFQHYYFRRKVVLENKLVPESRATVTFLELPCNTAGLVTCLHLNFCDEETNEKLNT